MELEIIARRPRGPRRWPKLLFVHGICVGAWVWNEHFLPFFADHGFEAYALSLRGHGQSSGRERIAEFALADYTDDLARTVERVGAPLVLVGHSLGGAVVQDFLRVGGRAAGAVLMASVPPHGLGLAAWHMLLTFPGLFRELATLLVLGIGAADPETIRRGLFSRDVPAREIERFLRRAQDESPRVGLELQGWRPIAPLPWQAPPLLVLGGMDDSFVPPIDVGLTAAYYGTLPVLLPDMAHAMMLEPRWQHAAEAILGWLERPA